MHLSGQKMEAISGQILFDFDAGELGGIKSFPVSKPKVNRMRESEVWFQKGLELEETGAPVEAGGGCIPEGAGDQSREPPAHS